MKRPVLKEYDGYYESNDFAMFERYADKLEADVAKLRTALQKTVSMTEHPYSMHFQAEKIRLLDETKPEAKK